MNILRKLILLIIMAMLSGQSLADNYGDINGNYGNKPYDSRHYSSQISNGAVLNNQHQNWFYNKQAALAKDPNFDPNRPGYSTNYLSSTNYDRTFDKESRLRASVNDPKLGKADRGWIRQEINRVDHNRSLGIRAKDNVRNPPGKDLAHQRGRENGKGYGLNYANLQNHDLHMLQHTGKLDGNYMRDKNNPDLGGDHFGVLNKERVPPAYQASIGNSTRHWERSHRSAAGN